MKKAILDFFNVIPYKEENCWGQNKNHETGTDYYPALSYNYKPELSYLKPWERKISKPRVFWYGKGLLTSKVDINQLKNLSEVQNLIFVYIF